MAETNASPRGEREAMRAYVAELGAENVIAVFDFGTRAVRVVVAPKPMPSAISEHTFRMAARRPSVGLDVVDERLPIKSPALSVAARFISFWRDFLRREGVRDFHLISTAWFRWLANKAEVRAFIERKTGLRIEEIDQAREAELVLRSLPILAERWRGGRLGPPITDDDVVALIDQGGGSLQVSWMRWRDRRERQGPTFAATYPTLGAIALRNAFFQSAGATGDRVDPQSNAATISDQIKAVAERARATLRSDITLPTAAACAPGTLHLFAVGSAITELPPKKGVYKRHNRSIEGAEIDAHLTAVLDRLDAPREQVRGVWRGMRLPAHKQNRHSEKWFERRAELDESLVALLGLPIYRAVMENMGVSTLTLSGYGLAYGYYFERTEQT